MLPSRLEELRTHPLMATAVLALVVAVLPLVLTSRRDLSVLSFVAIYAIVAYSIAISFRYVGVLMIAQGAVWGVGAYTAGLLRLHYDLSFWLVLPIAAVLGLVAAVAIGSISLRSKGHYFLVVTFAINEFIVLAANQLGFTRGRHGIQVLDPPDPIGPVGFTSPLSRYYLYGAFLVATMALFSYTQRTAFGRRLIAVRENEDLARSVGVSVLGEQLRVLAVGGAIAGVGGVLYVYHQQAIQPSLFSAIIFLQIILMVIIGGSRTTSGPFIGVLLMMLVPEWLGLSPIARQMTYGALLMVIILVAPQGVTGSIQDWSARLRRRRARGTRGSAEDHGDDVSPVALSEPPESGP